MNSSKWLRQRDAYEAAHTPVCDEIDEWADIGVPPERAKAYAEYCNQLEAEAGNPTFKEKRMAKEALQKIRDEMDLQTFNQRVKEQNEKVAKQAICVKCGHWFDRGTGGVHNGLNYCGYCDSVCFGKKDEAWPPSLVGRERP